MSGWPLQRSPMTPDAALAEEVRRWDETGLPIGLHIRDPRSLMRLDQLQRIRADRAKGGARDPGR